jgi:hypothetical protein
MADDGQFIHGQTERKKDEQVTRCAHLYQHATVYTFISLLGNSEICVWKKTLFFDFLKKIWINSFSKEWALQIPHKTLDYELPPFQIISRFDFFGSSILPCI